MHGQSDQARVGGGSLEALIAPIPVEQFVAEHFGSFPLHVEGDAGRFTGLLDWDGLERLIENHPVDETRLRLVRLGKNIPPKRYTRTLGGIDRIDGGALSLLLDSGATLIINHIDDLVREIAVLADDIGDRLGARTAVNLYASCRSDHGFDPHWDHHDVLVLQLAGRKTWSIYKPTRPDPLRGDPFVAPDEGGLDREVLLKDGDVLYLPRGWIHAPVPAGEASLHLTVAITRPTGAGFLEWLAKELTSNPQVRAAIPLEGDPTAWDHWKSSLAAIVSQAITGQSAERYIAHKSAGRGARPRISFRDLGRIPPGEWTDSTQLRPASLHRFVIEASETGSSYIEALGQTWPCTAAVAAAIGRLTSTRPLALGALQQALSKEEAAELRQLLAFLSTMGLLSATEE